MRKFSFIFFLLLSLSSFSQETYGKISGILVDVNNQPLEGVVVLLREKDIKSQTNSMGEFNFEKVPEGEFTLVIYAKDKDEITRKVLVTSYQESSLMIRMIDNVISLSSVAVRGKDKLRKLREQAMPVSIIGAKELNSGVNTVNDVISRTVGVKIRSTGGVGSVSRISLRGLEGKRIGIFVDEIAINENSDFIDLNDIPVDMISHIEIYKGIVPAKLGGSSMGGAVNIVLKEYPPFYLDLNYAIASYNTHKGSTVFKTNKNDYEFGVGGAYTYSDNNYMMELPLEKSVYVKRDHDQFKKLTIGGGLKVKKKWFFDEVEVEGVLTRTYKELQGINYSIKEAKHESHGFLFNNKLEKDNFLISGLDFELSSGYLYSFYEFQNKAQHRYDWHGHIIGPPVTQYGGEIIGKQPSDSKTPTYSFINRLNLSYLLNDWSSVNFNLISNHIYTKPEDLLKEKAIGHKTDYDSRMNNHIAGLNYEFRLFKNKLLNSLTGKYYHYEVETKIADFFNAQKVKNIHNVQNDWGFSNAVRYQFIPSFLIKLSFSYDVRLPSQKELIGDGYFISPSGNLIPERNSSANIGLLYERKFTHNRRFSLEVNGFYMYLENMIRFVGGPLQSNYSNFGKIKTKGAEAEFKWDISPFIFFYGNATYQDLRDAREQLAGSDISNPTKGDRIPNIPYFYVNGGIELHTKNLFGGKKQQSKLLMHSSFVESYFFDLEQSKYQERRIPSAFTADVGIEHSFNKQNIVLGFQINNATDAQVVSEFNRPLPGRNYVFKMKYLIK
ncbi:MAG: TonB-dependent receptor [Weeksellaceae bacterium]